MSTGDENKNRVIRERSPTVRKTKSSGRCVADRNVMATIKADGLPVYRTAVRDNEDGGEYWVRFKDRSNRNCRLTRILNRLANFLNMIFPIPSDLTLVEPLNLIRKQGSRRLDKNTNLIDAMSFQVLITSIIKS